MPETLVDQGELIRALGVLLDEPATEHRAVARALGLPDAPESGTHARLFMLNLYPYASVQVGAEGMMGGEARDRVAGFWRALGLTPPTEPDHLGALLGLWAALEEGAGAGAEAEQLMQRQAVDALLWEHLLPWAPAYLARARELGDRYYGGWAAILLTLLEERAGGVIERMASEEDKPDSLPLPLRSAPGLPDPRTPVGGAGERFMDALLAPVRSGMILTRLDLLRAGRQLGLGVRVGERKYTLRALFGQDPGATLGWLSEETETWVHRHGTQMAAFGPIARFWRDRAQQAAALLNELASSEAASEWAEPATASATKGEGRDA